GAADVGLVPHLDHAAGVVEGGGEQATRAVVFHAPGEHPLPGGGQRGHDGVAGVAPDGAPVPGELQRLAAGDHLARLPRPPPAPAGLAHRTGSPARAPAVPSGISARPARAPALPSSALAPAAVADRTSLVSVCRSTLMNRRQPIRWYQVSLIQPHGVARRYR